MKIGGLASGIDTESIIKDLMNAERIPLDKMTQKKQYFEWQLNDYRTANRDLKDFSTKLFDNMILTKNFNAKNVTVSDPNAVSIKAKGNTENFSGTITVNDLATSATVVGSKIAEGNKDFKVPAEGAVIEITAPNGEMRKVTLSEGDDIKEIAKKITAQSDVRAFYDETTGQIGLSSKLSGKGAGDGNIVLKGSILTNLGLDSDDPENKDIVKTAGKNSELVYNGMTITRPSNTFELDGMEITLKEANKGKEITFNATTDTDKVFDNIKGFVDDYNKLIEDLNKKIREPKYRDYQPLTTEQKADMKDKEIEMWEEKAMSGTLRNNPELSNLLSSMRSVLNTSVQIGPKKEDTISLSSIGITTSSDYLDHGKLIIDETKLKEAIAKDPQNIQKLFGQETAGTVEEGAKGSPAGIARLLRDQVDATQKVIQKKAGKVGDTNKAFTLGQTLDSMNKSIERFQTKLEMVESRYWKQFTAMENAIQRANAQSASLMSALGQS